MFLFSYNLVTKTKYILSETGAAMFVVHKAVWEFDSFTNPGINMTHLYKSVLLFKWFLYIKFWDFRVGQYSTLTTF